MKLYSIYKMTFLRLVRLYKNLRKRKERSRIVILIFERIDKNTADVENER